MTPEEFKEARRKLGLSQSQLGEILNTNPATIRKWEAEEDRATSRSPNPVASQAMRWFLSGFRPPEWPDRTCPTAHKKTAQGRENVG